MPAATCPGTPDAGDLHVRCDGGGATGGNAGPRYPTAKFFSWINRSTPPIGALSTEGANGAILAAMIPNGCGSFGTVSFTAEFGLFDPSKLSASDRIRRTVAAVA